VGQTEKNLPTLLFILAFLKVEEVVTTLYQPYVSAMEEVAKTALQITLSLNEFVQLPTAQIASATFKQKIPSSFHIVCAPEKKSLIKHTLLF
jgi:hypothetical protein